MLAKAFLSLRSLEECETFFADIFTQREIIDLSSRLEVARLLSSGSNYTDIAAKTGASTATISRVSKCLAIGNGYRTVLERIHTVEGDNGELSIEGLTAEQKDAIIALIKSFKV